jgi:cupin 2 domain-containing protein
VEVTVISNNIFDNLPKESLPEELAESLLQEPGISIKRIISTGQITPKGQWYDQAEDEWVILLKGHARLFFALDNKELVLKAGDYAFIPAHCKHRVSWTDPNDICVWLTVYLVPREGLEPS